MVFSEILDGLVQWILVMIQAYGPYSVFVAVILEEVLIPIPSPLVIMGAAFILIPANLAFWDAIREIFFVIVVPASIASTIGSFFTYGMFQKFLGVNWVDIQKKEKQFEKGKKVWTTIALLRAIPFFPIAIVSLTAGVLRLSWKKYALATFIGSIPRTFILAIIGWQLGSAYISIASRLSELESLLAVVVIAAIAYGLYRYRHKYAHHYRSILKSVEMKPAKKSAGSKKK
ncbi:MAG: VTT domain-containing protein [Candidatus Aenigmarchaeota archaeon]|nr:VTT domain-containing protein [Candidatus Aenigmarchaeota archaeon]